MTSAFQWRRFNFFDSNKDVRSLKDVLEESDVKSTSSGRGHLIFGDSAGFLHFFDRDLNPKSLKVFEGSVIRIVQLRQSGLLIAVGTDSKDSILLCLKVLDLDAPEAGTANPSVVRVSKIPMESSLPTSLAAHENRSLLAIGFEDGTILFYRGDVARERGTKIKTLKTSGSVSGISFRVTASATFMYVATVSDVFCYNVSSVKGKELKAHLDGFGCSQGLAIQVDMQLDTHFVVARKDGVYCYTPESRSQCYAFEGDKTQVHWFKSYLVIVSSEAENKSTLTVFDVQNKFVAYSETLPTIQRLLSEWGSLYSLSADSKNLMELTEKDTRTKLDILFRKNFYDMAIKIAKNQHVDSDGLMNIFRLYGDHLYSKGDYSGAIENYNKTVGSLEPSYVIRKFLDAQRIYNLTNYLQNLHVAGLANEDHTTLLLNCYTKLKDNEKLDEFIMSETRAIDFDVDIAIKVCRQSAYYEHALMLAKKHFKHEWYLKIILEDKKKYLEALDYLKTLDVDSAEKGCRQYGGSLMKGCPEETTELLVRICSEIDHAHPGDYIHFFTDKPQLLGNFLEKIFELGKATPDASISLLEHYLSLKKPPEDKIMNLLKNGTYDSDQALIHCKTYSFHLGVSYLFGKKENFVEILNHYMDIGDLENSLECCRRYGNRDPYLWVLALKVISGDPQATPEMLTEILESIESKKLLSQLDVLGTLGSVPDATLGLVRDYFVRFLEAEDRAIEENFKAVEAYKADSQKVRERIKKLENETIIFQCSKCSACSSELELPSVHFLCQHSFHRQCFQSFSLSEHECPTCLDSNKKILDIVKSQENCKDYHDAFHYQLGEAQDGFSVVAEYFGRGLFRDPIKKDTFIPPSANSNPLPAFNESRMRVEEIRGGNYDRPQISEGRLRSQVPSSNLSENITLKEEIRHTQSSTNPFDDEPTPPPSSSNPFGDDGDDDYDEELNPFA